MNLPGLGGPVTFPLAPPQIWHFCLNNYRMDIHEKQCCWWRNSDQIHVLCCLNTKQLLFWHPCCSLIPTCAWDEHNKVGERATFQCGKSCIWGARECSVSVLADCGSVSTLASKHSFYTLFFMQNKKRLNILIGERCRCWKPGFVTHERS